MADAEKQEVEVARPRAHGLAPFFDNDFERLLNGFFGRSWMPSFPSALANGPQGPRVDVVDRDDEVLVRAELPGVDKENLDVSMSDRTVTIRAKTHHESTEEEKGEYIRREITSGSFSRTVALPSDVDGDKAEAAFNDGLLEIKVPKAEVSRKRRIEIS